MRVHLIHPSELGPSEVRAWRAMQRATPSLDNPFLSPEYATAVGSLRPGSRVAVLTEGARAIGFFPFERRRFRVGVPISGWLSPYQGVVHAPDADWNVPDLMSGCGLAAWKFDNVIAGQAPFKPYHLSTRPAPAIDLSGGFDAYYEELYAREHRLCRELARKARKLEREVGPVSLDCGSRNVGALRTLMAWKSEQYRRTGCVDRFEQSWVPSLAEALLAAQGAEFGGLLSVLSADGRPIAIQFGLRAGRLLVGWFTGYDPRYGKYSPGLIHLLRMTESLCAMGVDTIHMGKGALRYCRPLKNDGIMVGDGVVTTKGVIGVAQHSYTVMGRRALAMVRKSPWLRNGLNQAFRGTGLSSRLDGRL